MGFLLCAIALVAGVPERVEVALPAAGQSVFLTEAEAVRARERCERLPWAGALRTRLVRQADGLVAAELAIPHEEGQWPHWYACPEDGGRLKALSPTEHRCGVCGTVYSGPPYDQVYISSRHGRWLHGLEILGWAHTLAPKPAYPARAREILLEYASFYSDLEPHDVHNKKGKSKARLYAQTLDEAVTLCRVAVGYDLLHNAPCFSEADHKAIEEGLLRPMVATIQANLSGISNWQSWHNGAVGCVGFVLRDAELVDWAINGTNGFLFQMKHSVMASGMWYEESPSYHWYALVSHVYLMEAAARAGADLYAIPVVKGLFDAPLRQLFPDGTFPAMHDSDRSSIHGQRRFYEISYARYQDPAYLALLGPRDSDWALFWGGEVDETALGGSVELATSNSLSEGLAILRDGAGETALFLDYGPGMSGHVQPAKLNIVLYAHGQERLVDPGRLSYGNPLHGGWYRQTVAHNTVVVNGASQKRSPGELVAFEDNEDYALVRAVSKKAYDGVILDRTVLLRENAIVDVVQCRAEEAVVFDLPLHFQGDLGDLGPTQECAPLGESNGYQYLKELVQCVQPPKAFDVGCGEERRIHIEFCDGAETYRALGFGNPPQKLLPVVLRRVRGMEAVFVTAYHILKPGESSGAAEVLLGEEVSANVAGLMLVLTGDKTVVRMGDEEAELGPLGGP